MLARFIDGRHWGLCDLAHIDSIGDVVYSSAIDL